MQTLDRSYTPEYLSQWQTPQYYFGATWEGWYVFLSQTRDSDTLNRSNYRVALARLKALDTELTEEHAEGCSSVCETRQSHFAVGWVEIILIHSSNEAAVRLADDMARRLDSYAVLSEDDWSRLESEEADAAWRAMSIGDRIEACKRYRVSIFAARRDEVPEDETGELTPWLADGC